MRKNTVLLTTAFAGAFAFELWVTSSLQACKTCCALYTEH